MLLLHAIACAVLVVNVSAKGVSFRPDFFHPLRGLAMPLEPNVQEHGRREGDIPPELWFEQKLDHFTPSNTEVFSQVCKVAFIRRTPLPVRFLSGECNGGGV